MLSDILESQLMTDFICEYEKGTLISSNEITKKLISLYAYLSINIFTSKLIKKIFEFRKIIHKLKTIKIKLTS